MPSNYSPPSPSRALRSDYCSASPIAFFASFATMNTENYQVASQSAIVAFVQIKPDESLFRRAVFRGRLSVLLVPGTVLLGRKEVLRYRKGSLLCRKMPLRYRKEILLCRKKSLRHRREALLCLKESLRGIKMAETGGFYAARCILFGN